MARHIDADRLKRVLENNFGHTGGADTLRQLIDAQPTVDMGCTIHSEWVSNGASSCSRVRYSCRNCHHVTGYKQVGVYDFCPKCGANMRGDDN